MINGQIDTIRKISETVTEAKIHITITQSPCDFGTQFILQTLQIVSLITGDVIRIPADRNIQTIVRGIAHLEKAFDISALVIRVMRVSVLMLMFIVSMLSVPFMVIIMILPLL